MRDDMPGGMEKTLSYTDHPDGHDVAVTTGLGRQNLYQLRDLPGGGQAQTIIGYDGLSRVTDMTTYGLATLSFPGDPFSLTSLVDTTLIHWRTYSRVA